LDPAPQKACLSRLSPAHCLLSRSALDLDHPDGLSLNVLLLIYIFLLSEEERSKNQMQYLNAFNKALNRRQ